VSTWDLYLDEESAVLMAALGQVFDLDRIWDSDFLERHWRLAPGLLRQALRDDCFRGSQRTFVELQMWLALCSWARLKQAAWVDRASWPLALTLILACFTPYIRSPEFWFFLGSGATMAIAFLWCVCRCRYWGKVAATVWETERPEGITITKVEEDVA